MQRNDLFCSKAATQMRFTPAHSDFWRFRREVFQEKTEKMFVFAFA